MSKFRLALAGAVSMQALCIASAEEIDSTRTTPIATSTANSGSADDVIITTNGAIEIDDTSGFAAVTLDSNNDVDVRGEITLTETDDAQAILMKDGFAGDVTISGDILFDDGYSREDDDDDDDLDGPFAAGENRIGVFLESGGTFTGDIDILSGGAISVEGNQSAGILLDSLLDGSLTLDGTIEVVGEDALAIGINENVTGDVLLSGSIQTIGKDAAGVIVTGDVDGIFANEGTIISTGFASTTLSNYVPPASVDDDTPPLDERIDAEDLNDNRPAMGVGGSLANGFLNNGDIGGRDEDDETKDAIEDYDENRGTGTIRSFGSAPAVLISPDLDASGTGDLELGTVVEKVRDTTDDDDDDDTSEILKTFNYDYGFINRGTISGNGLNSGYEATALRIEGSEDGTRSTIVNGGLYNGGAITASARDADATAISLGAGAVIGRIDNDGNITASLFSEAGNDAVAVRIEDGASVGSFYNSGQISSTAYGLSGTSTALLDESNTLTSIVNQGDIAAFLSQLDEEAAGATRAVAIDLSGHDASTPVTIAQSFQTPTQDVNGDGEIDTDDVNTPSITGAVLLGAGNDLVDIRAGTVSGVVEMGAGADRFLVNDAVLETDIDFGSGADIFSLSGGAEFRGVIADADQTLAITVVDSFLAVENSGSLVIDTLSVTGDSALEINIDLTSDDLSEPRIIAQTSALIDGQSAEIIASIDNFTNTASNVVLIQSPDLTFNANAEFDVETPAIFLTDIALSDTELSLVIRPKTAGELGLNIGETAAYAAIINLASENGAVGDALTSYFDEAELLDGYRSLMPVRHEPATRIISSANSLATGPLAQRIDLLSYQNASDGVGYWAQLDAGYVKHDGSEELAGYDGPLISFHGGFDRSIAPNLLVGLSGAFLTADGRNDETHEKSAETTAFQIGPYAAWQAGPLTLSAAGAYGFAQINTERVLSFGEDLQTLSGDRNGNYFAGSARAAFEAGGRSFYVRPAASIDYLTLRQKSYTEISNQAESAYAYSVDGTTTDRVSASGVLNIGRRSGEFGRNTERGVSGYGAMGGYTSQRVTFQNIYGGYRTEISNTPYETTATLIETGDSFTILDPDTYDDALLFGASFGYSDDGLTLSVSYDGEMSDDIMIHRAGLNFRMKF